MEDEIIEYESSVRRKVGGLIYRKCRVCGDISATQNLNRTFCINEHKIGDRILQPVSCGNNMHGKIWEDTPYGNKTMIKD